MGERTMQKYSWVTVPVPVNRTTYPNSFVEVNHSTEKRAKLAGLKVKNDLFRDVAIQIRDDVDREIMKDLLAINAVSNL